MDTDRTRLALALALALALRRLDDALAEQSRRAQAFRAATADLGRSVADLGGSLRLYQRRLARLQEEVACLGAKARRLEALMEEAAAGGRPVPAARAA